MLTYFFYGSMYRLFINDYEYYLNNCVDTEFERGALLPSAEERPIGNPDSLLPGKNCEATRFVDQNRAHHGVSKAGIGTYLKKQFMTRTVSWLASKLDEAIAISLNDHVKEG